MKCLEMSYLANILHSKFAMTPCCTQIRLVTCTKSPQLYVPNYRSVTVSHTAHLSLTQYIAHIIIPYHDFFMPYVNTKSIKLSKTSFSVTVVLTVK